VGSGSDRASATNRKPPNNPLTLEANTMRDKLMGELNKLADRAADLRDGDGNVDDLIEVTARINGVRAELAALDAREIPTVPAVEAAAVSPRSFGEAALATGFVERGINGAPGVINRDVFSGPAAGGLDVVVPDFTPGIDAQPRNDVTVLDLIPTLPTSSDTIVFYVQTGFVNASAGIPRRVTVNGDTTYGAYQLSDVTVEKKTVPVVKVGHAFPTDEDTLSDSPAMAALLNRDGIDGVRRELEAQLLAASDTANGLSSLIVTGTGRAQVQEYAAGGDGQDLIEAIRQAKTKAELAAIRATFVLLTPEARERVELAKDEDGRYLGAGPFAGLNGTLWQLPMVTSYFLPEGVDAVVGSFEKVRLRVRRGIEVQMTNSHGEDFLKDAIKIKVSGRYALENTRPEAMVVVGEAAGDDEE
jgi:HK97 family phage major capsid protein